MAEVIWDMSQAPYSLDETGDAKVITAAAIAAADTLFAAQVMTASDCLSKVVKLLVTL